MRLTQYLIEDAFENGMSNHPQTKIPSIYDSKMKYNRYKDPQLYPEDDEDDEDKPKDYNQFNDTPDEGIESDDDESSSREQRIDDALKRLRDVILGTDDRQDGDSEGDEFSNKMDQQNSSNMFNRNIEDEEMQPNKLSTGDDNFGNSLDQQDPQQEQEIPRRYVKNAHLVYKRKTPEGLYEELWIYNIGHDDNARSREYDIRREILRGTDIEQRDTESEDGSQYYEIWTAGNAQMLHIVGLPN